VDGDGDAVARQDPGQRRRVVLVGVDAAVPPEAFSAAANSASRGLAASEPSAIA
jgi:hypothetical protein